MQIISVEHQKYNVIIVESIPINKSFIHRFTGYTNIIIVPITKNYYFDRNIT